MDRSHKELSERLLAERIKNNLKKFVKLAGWAKNSLK